MANNQESISSVCEYRMIPEVKKGAPCEVDGRKGRVWGGNSSANFNIKFDDDGSIRNCHPYWKMKIYTKEGDVFYEHTDD